MYRFKPLLTGLVVYSQETMLFRLRLGFRADGQCVNFIASGLLCQAQVIRCLQIEPEFRGGFEPMAEAQGGVAGDRPFAGNDLADTVLRYVELLREFFGADSDFAQFVAKNFAGVCRRSGHALSAGSKIQKQEEATSKDDIRLAYMPHHSLAKPLNAVSACAAVAV
jgi:hypothetical protein